MLVCSTSRRITSDDPVRGGGSLSSTNWRSGLGRRGLRIGYEALSWGTRVRTFDNAWDIVSRANHPHLGLILDSFHTLALSDNWSGLSRLPGEKKIFFGAVGGCAAPRRQCADLEPSLPQPAGPGRPGRARFPAQRAGDRLHRRGTISLEIFNDDLRAAPPRQTAHDGMRSLLFLEEQVRRSEETPREAPPRKIRRRVELFDPPTPPALAGVAFIEFAVDETGERQLGEFLGQLGFRAARPAPDEDGLPRWSGGYPHRPQPGAAIPSPIPIT